MNKYILIIILFFQYLLDVTAQNTNYYSEYIGSNAASNIQGNEYVTWTKTGGGTWLKSKVIRFPNAATFAVRNNAQTVTNQTITSNPSSTVPAPITDSYGNYISTFEVSGPLTSLTLKRTYTASSVINTPAVCFSDAYPLTTTVPSDIQVYLNSTTKVQSDNTTIKAQAQSIVTGCTTMQCAVQEIAKWVRGNIVYQTGDNIAQDALSVYNRKTGDCTGFTHITLALLRSISIPARFNAGFLLPMTFNMPYGNGYITVGGFGPGPHGCHEIYYPSINNWVMGDAQMSVHFVSPNFVKIDHGPDGDAVGAQIQISYPSNEQPPVLSKNWTINTTIGSVNPYYDYVRTTTFGGIYDRHSLIAAKDECIAVGPYDKVEIKDPPSSLQLPPNTLIVTPGTQASYYAKFTSGMGGTSAVSYDWTITLYYDGGTYTYAQGLLQPDKGDYSVWKPTLPASLPNYNWAIDPLGNIYGEVKVFVHISDGYIENDRTSIGVVCAQNLQNITYTTSQTITGCRISATNVTIQNNCNVTFDAGEININGPFEVKQGAAFEAK